MFIGGGVMEGKQDLFMGGITWQAFVTAIWEGFTCVAMITWLLTLFRRRWNTQGRLAKAMAASSYATYIVHGTVLISLGLLLRGIRILHLLNFLLVAPFAVTIAFLIGYGLKKLPLARQVL
jgi:hypothetical protein